MFKGLTSFLKSKMKDAFILIGYIIETYNENIFSLHPN